MLSRDHIQDPCLRYLPWPNKNKFIESIDDPIERKYILDKND